MSDITVVIEDGENTTVVIENDEDIIVEIQPEEITTVVTVAEQGPEGIQGSPGTIILYGTGDPPDPTGLPEGTLYLRYTE